MKRFLTMMAVSALTIGLLAGCNTMAGAGQDVQKAGEAIEDKATD